MSDSVNLIGTWVLIAAGFSSEGHTYDIYAVPGQPNLLIEQAVAVTIVT